jgi:hypothetical protein
MMLFILPWCGCSGPSTEKEDKILSAHNQIDTGNLLSNVLTFGIEKCTLSNHLVMIAVLSQSLIGLRAAMSLTLPAR